jgi:hypothetical protein
LFLKLSDEISHPDSYRDIFGWYDRFLLMAISYINLIQNHSLSSPWVKFFVFFVVKPQRMLSYSQSSAEIQILCVLSVFFATLCGKTLSVLKIYPQKKLKLLQNTKLYTKRTKHLYSWFTKIAASVKILSYFASPSVL